MTNALHASPLLFLNRAHALLYCAALLALLYHHTLSILSSPALLSSLLPLSLLLADAVLAFQWLNCLAFRWRPVRRTEYPDRLLAELGGSSDRALPALDVFICTCDPLKEPPMGVVSTALSVMAFDYPTDRLSVYVSDDGGAAVTLFAFTEAAKFARHWLPFCRESGLLDRSPEAFFRSGNCTKESEELKIMYEGMKGRVEDTLERGHVDSEQEIFKKWKSFERSDHPSVVQVLVESSKDWDTSGKALPNLIYMSREKRPSAPHHNKAGALNALLRVSSVLTNAPVILTVDCDMCSNDPISPLRALCYLLDPAMSGDLAFVQFPQHFRGINRNDIYASELKRLFQIDMRGMDGLRGGPKYVGTGCYFSRRALTISHGPKNFSFSTDITPANCPSFSDTSLTTAHQVTSCTYELNGKWGSLVGFRYGSLVEDFITGLHLQCEGWRSVFCDPDRPAFLGDVPQSLHDVLSQCKRWCIGLYEVAFSKHSPLIFGTKKISLLDGFGYAYYAFWGSWCIPITIYGLLPPLALANQVPLFPKVSSGWFYLYAYLFLAAYGQELLEFLMSDGRIRRWWSDQRLWLYKGFTSYLFATVEFALRQVGVSASGFNVTSKVTEEEQGRRYERGEFDFGMESSPFFVSLGAAAVVNLSSLVVGVVRAVTVEGMWDAMFAQLFMAGFAVANGWPVYEAMLMRRDGGRMNRNVTLRAFALAALIHYIAHFIFN